MTIRLLSAAALLAAAATPAAAQNADADAGKRAFLQCRACHTVDAGGRNLAGPNLHGMFGAKMGSKPGFTYSTALKNAGFAWTEERLDKWLADPRGALPGNRMLFLGVKDPKVRRLLIAYLKKETAK